MEYRTLGRTGLRVGALGLGTEYLLNQSAATMAAVLDAAQAAGVNLVDVLFALPRFLDDLHAALGGRREQFVLAAHWGSGMTKSQPCNVRGRDECVHYIEETYTRLRTDYLDIVFLHMVDTDWEYDTWFAEMLPLVERYRADGRVRFIGMSSHQVPVALRAVHSGLIDVLLFPINLAANTLPGKKELFEACIRENVALVAMKPYGGGTLLEAQSSAWLHWVQSGGECIAVSKSAALTPTQCLAYVLAQPGVSSVVPGVRDLAQWQAALAALEAPDEARDWSQVVSLFRRYVTGQCVYCNHCLPCPAGIDIGETLRLLDSALCELTPSIANAYRGHAANASDCLQCGDCLPRCPFEVDVVGRMQQAVEVFGTA